MMESYLHTLCCSGSGWANLTPLKVHKRQPELQRTINLVRPRRVRPQLGRSCHVGGQCYKSSTAQRLHHEDETGALLTGCFQKPENTDLKYLWESKPVHINKVNSEGWTEHQCCTITGELEEMRDQVMGVFQMKLDEYIVYHWLLSDVCVWRSFPYWYKTFVGHTQYSSFFWASITGV